MEKAYEYIYRGIVKVVGEPYQEEQPDKNGNMRKVWMFPVKMVKDVETAEAEADEKLLEALENLSERDYPIPDFDYILTPQDKTPPITRDHSKFVQEIQCIQQLHYVMQVFYVKSIENTLLL